MIRDVGNKVRTVRTQNASTRLVAPRRYLQGNIQVSSLSELNNGVCFVSLYTSVKPVSTATIFLENVGRVTTDLVFSTLIFSAKPLY